MAVCVFHWIEGLYFIIPVWQDSSNLPNMPEVLSMSKSNLLHGKLKSNNTASFDVDSQHEDNDEAQFYPMGLQLAVITISLMLAVFCVALDNTVQSIPSYQNHYVITNMSRRSWQWLFPKSPINSML